MIKNIVFDFGGVLVDWNPHHLYDGHFGDREKAEWFLANICTMEWNSQMDAGKPFAEGIAELSRLHPEWSDEIHMYFDRWIEMMGSHIPGMIELVSELKYKGYHVFGLTNWSSETFCQVRHKYEIFNLLNGIMVSGEEHLAKPDVRYFRLFLARYGLEAGECVFVDDRQDNVNAASDIGMRAILFNNAHQLRTILRINYGLPL